MKGNIMALIERKIDKWSQSVSSLLDKPRMTAKELKAAFYSNSNQTKQAINGIIDELVADDGASSIGFKMIDGLNCDNVQQAIVFLSDNLLCYLK